MCVYKLSLKIMNKHKSTVSNINYCSSLLIHDTYCINDHELPCNVSSYLNV